ncbi:MAG: thiamine biosynthesis protein ApbE [Stutzerimonas stutzeri]|nr:MAG: thiamine biosynthesis protein ApbE [Stutzerimonas stutzeri]
MIGSLSRRRFVTITAAAVGLGFAGGVGKALAETAPVTWRGSLMGADASLRIHHPDASAAQRLVERSIEEVRRLEGIFSLHRADSAVAQLNKRGFLVAPPPELVEVLDASKRYHALTDGAFDPTVQPLWSLYRGHFSQIGADPEGPSPSLVAGALNRVGFRHVSFDRNRVAFGRVGMELTFNGIAQGYATDRVVAILRAGGIEQSLVDMGEPRAMGSSLAGGPWKVGIADPDEADRVGELVEVIDRAVATSAGYGFRFDKDGQFNHLFDPRSGRSAQLYKCVTLILPTAMQADALSTAYNLMPLDDIQRVQKILQEGEVRIVTAAGERNRIAL